MYAYVINLARCPDRRLHMIAELQKSGIGYEIIDAIDGRQLDLNDPRTISDIAPSFLNFCRFRPGSAACAMSHLTVYRKILADGLNEALVLEDDVQFPADLADLADAVAKNLAGSEVALLNFDSNETCKMSLEGSVDLPPARKLVLPADINQPKSAAAYIITREACRRMVETELPIRARSDQWEHFCNEGVLDRLRCVVPLAVAKSPNFASTVGRYSEKSLKGRLLSMVIRYNLSPLQRMIAYRRLRILRKHTRVEFS